MGVAIADNLFGSCLVTCLNSDFGSGLDCGSSLDFGSGLDCGCDSGLDLGILPILVPISVMIIQSTVVTSSSTDVALLGSLDA